jgi:hypothetical protein
MQHHRLRYHRSDLMATIQAADWRTHVAYKPAWLRQEIREFRARLDSMPVYKF